MAEVNMKILSEYVPPKGNDYRFMEGRSYVAPNGRMYYDVQIKTVWACSCEVNGLEPVILYHNSMKFHDENTVMELVDYAEYNHRIDWNSKLAK